MSDPNFWTPPSSPKFGGDRLGVLDDVEGDLFAETEAGRLKSDSLRCLAYGGIFTSPKMIGLVCGHLNRNDFLQSFERPLDKNIPIDPFVCLGELWSRFLVLINDIAPRSDFTIETIRNDISILLSSALQLLSCTSTDSSLVPVIVTRLRALLVNVGRLEFKRSSSSHFIHAQIELWIFFFKLLEVVRDNHGNSATRANTLFIDSLSLVNELFNLDATSILDAHGYFVDVVLENLIHLYSMPSRFLHCSCIDLLWTLVIRYSEEFQVGWFKYLHGKLIKLSSSRKADVYKPCSLESLRPNPVIHTDGQCSADVKNQALWSLYWSLLAHTAPLHRDYIVFRLHGDVSPEQIQKYSIVVWLIRKLFLGVSPSYSVYLYWLMGFSTCLYLQDLVYIISGLPYLLLSLYTSLESD
ncbi:hypothetical protein PHET_10261 [Paragonimus heterotremus]|uniref:Uncharacterized protein n=1 Tax=Paragonimus heterotremus TaxID=100268 RepID=A0A8J4SS00_9TREM|nr:hypothetical protein PHET_10261 [Paragonimus heterotremus]